MRIFRKQTGRAPVTTVLLILLLALSIAASSIGFAARTGAEKQAEEIDSQYTTIGIHAGLNYDMIWSRAASIMKPTGSDSITFADGSVYVGPIDAADCAEKSSAFLSGSNSVLLSAHVEGTTSLTSGTMDILDYIYSHDSFCYNLAVFAIQCISVEYLENWPNWKTYQVTATILDDVCLMGVYDLPPENDTIEITSSLFTEDGEIPFEPGNTYLVRGIYWDYRITDLGFQSVFDEDGTERFKMVRGRYENDPRQLFMEGDGRLVEHMATPGRNSGVENFTYNIHIDPDTEMIYFTQAPDCWPYYVEYEGTWQDYLASDDGAVWRDEIIPNFEINHASAPVILTDDINNLYLFNTGDASIMEGRSIERSEYENGDSVCLVSASYAKLNGLTVGDTISLDYYNSGYDQMECVIHSISGKQSLTLVRKPMTPARRMDIKKDYTIVGIYSSPEWTPGVQNFHADTIFVPKASVPGADKIVPFMYESMNAKTMSMLNTISIKNGAIDEFEAHMAENNMAGVYLYFDQGYSEAATSVQTLLGNSTRLMLVGAAMFVLASLLFLLLFVRRTAPVVRSMRLLGVAVRQTWRECFGALLVQEAFAALLGNGLSILLYDRITRQLLSEAPALSPESVALCAAVQLGILILAGGLWLYAVAGRNLMHKGQRAFPARKPRPVSVGT